MDRIRAVLFDLGNTLSVSASLSTALANLRQHSVIGDLDLDNQQLYELGEEIERQDEQADIGGGNEMGFTTVKVVKNKGEAESAADYAIFASSLVEFFRDKVG